MSEVTQNDVQALYDDASPERRAVLAQKIGHNLTTGTLSETEEELAVAICQKLAEDVNLTVRQTLSKAIKNCPDIPKDLAIQLANDVIEVGLPMIEFSTLLDDKDLIALARTGDVGRQMAITHRKTLSPVLSHTLAEECGEAVVESLLKNEGAELVDETYEAVLDRFNNSPAIHTSMAQRHKLPKRIIQRMVNLVSEQLKAYLIANHPVPTVLVEKMVLESREDAVRRLLADPLSTRDAETLVQELSKQGRLSTELIFRALEIGDRAFFEYAMADRVNIPVDAARTLIKDPGERGFSALYDKAGMPKEDFQSINYLVEVEYRSRRHAPLTRAEQPVPAEEQEPESWLTETSKKSKKWRLF
ncbi:DUF2336 domain-containing protein [Terasakiella sp. A23]|uniref:DUF2336 domain-containing protein n=1 Tax=Terasakiella sp. FCG-A23 TaxID=3080561 RepID=UPI002954D7FD|nr:DUF2336 domain-containing protein [Terasakiella sp. A23]MDV7338239.1 DUF2336 domain-containing protein [Terasakiella sp. A23]